MKRKLYILDPYIIIFDQKKFPTKFGVEPPLRGPKWALFSLDFVNEKNGGYKTCPFLVIHPKFICIIRKMI